MKKFMNFSGKIRKLVSKEYIITSLLLFAAFLAIYWYLMFGYIMTTPKFTYSVF